MKTRRLPNQLDTKKLCQEASGCGNTISGTLKISELPNLDGALANNSGDVEVKLACNQDKEGYATIAGSLVTELVLICERCLEEMQYLLEAEFLVSPVETEKAAKELPERYEPVMVVEGILSLADWLSEEILLNLPLAPKHETAACNRESLSAGHTEEVIEEKPNPFNVLADLKTKQ